MYLQIFESGKRSWVEETKPLKPYFRYRQLDYDSISDESVIKRILALFCYGWVSVCSCVVESCATRKIELRIIKIGVFRTVLEISKAFKLGIITTIFIKLIYTQEMIPNIEDWTLKNNNWSWRPFQLYDVLKRFNCQTKF